MNNHFKNEEHGNLIHRALADEGWTAFDTQLRKDALRSFTASKRRRRIAFVATQAAAILFLAGALTWGLAHSPRPLPAPESAIAANTEKASPSFPNLITEEQMLAMFPPGSCVLAEINGEKQLVFLDAKMARDGFPLEPPGVSPFK